MSFKVDSEVVYSRWQSFCAICLYMSFAGTIFAFNIYGDLLKEELGFDQNSLTTIASIGNCGNLLGVVVGFCIEKYGNRVVMGFGSFSIFVGYMYMWLAISGLVPGYVGAVTLFYFIAQMGVCCYINTALISAIQLFPSESRGSAIGICRAYFGLSSAVLGDLAGGIFQIYPNSFVLFVALFVPFTGLLGTFLSSPLPTHMRAFSYERSMGLPTSLNALFYHWSAAFVMLFTVGYLQHHMDFSASQLLVCSSVVVAFMLSLLVVVPSTYGPRVLSATLAGVYSHLSSQEREAEREADEMTKLKQLLALPAAPFSPMGSTSTGKALEMDKESDSEESTLLASSYHGGGSNNSGSSPMSPRRKAARQECFYGSSMTLEDAVQTWRYWAIFVIFFTVAGSAFLLVFNLTDIAVSIGAEASPFYVTLVALGSGVGKICAGKASDVSVRNGWVSTQEMMSVVCLVMSWLLVMLSLGRESISLPCFFWVGFANGATLSLISIITTDIFGWTHIATTLPLIDIAPILGSFLFSNTLMAIFYRENSVDEVSGLPVCVGANCYSGAFRVCALCCSLCAIGTVYLHVKTKIDR